MGIPLLLGIGGLLGTAAAQVNAENFAAAARGPGVGLDLSVGQSSASGNVDLFDLREDGAVRYLSAFGPDRAPNEELWFRDRVILTARGAHRGVEGTPVLNEALVHLRLTHNLVPRFGLETFGQVNRDRVLLLEQRWLAGAGIRAVAFLTERAGLWGGTGAMIEHEVRDLPPGDPQPVKVWNPRSTSYLSWRWAVWPDVLSWVNTAYLQPRLDDPADLQFVDEAELVIGLGEGLALRSALRVRQDSRPPADLDRWDLRVGHSLSLSWSRPGPED